MYIIIGSHFVPFEGKFILIALVIVRITLNVIVNVSAAGGNNIVKVFESLTTSFWTIDTSLFSGHLGAFDALSHLMLSLE